MARRRSAAPNTGEETVEMFAAPVTTTETQLTQVPNNGHGMAPYMMSVALWVGCIAFSLMYPLTEYSGKPEKRRRLVAEQGLGAQHAI